MNITSYLLGGFGALVIIIGTWIVSNVVNYRANKLTRDEVRCTNNLLNQILVELRRGGEK
jgi:hypothetical protein